MDDTLKGLIEYRVRLINETSDELYNMFSMFAPPIESKKLKPKLEKIIFEANDCLKIMERREKKSEDLPMDA